MPSSVRNYRWFTSSNIYLYLIGVCCLLETLCFTYLQLHPAFGVYTAALYFISGLAICVLSMLFAVNTVSASYSPVVRNSAFLLPVKLITFSAFIIFISVLLFQFGNKIFPTCPIDFRCADMLPLLRAACERCLNHQQVYAPVKEVWGGENIPYLPAMWMPFIPSVWLQTDMRWTTIITTILSVLAISVATWRLSAKAAIIFAAVFLPGIFMIVKFYTWKDRSLFEFSEEAVPVFYFTLLFIGLMNENNWLTGIMLALCTLSRFSLLPFVPFFFLWMAINGGLTKAIKIGIVYTILVLLIFVIPFFIAQPQYFLNIPNGYLRNVTSFWKSKGYTLLGTENLGLAYIFGYEHLEAMRMISNILLVAIPTAWLVSFIALKKRYNIRKNIWAMAGLKLTLVIFYNFITIPYLYIFMVPVFISYPLFLAVVKEAEI